MANKEFAQALKWLRLKYKLSQEAVAKIAGIIQSEYSAFERLKRKLSLDDADKLAKKVWGVPYTDLVKFSRSDIHLEILPYPTQEAIAASSSNKLKSSDNLLAKELDHLISTNKLNKPTTSKLLLAQMDKSLANKKVSEVTNLLRKAPRNKTIVSIGKSGTQSIFVHKNYAQKYEKLSKKKLIELIVDEERCKLP